VSWVKTKSWLIYIENVTAIVYIVLTLGSIPFADLAITLGILLGGAIGLANFALLIRIIEKVLVNERRPQPSYFAFSWVKFAVIVTVLFFAVKSGEFNPIALAVGISDFVLGIFIGTIIWTAKNRFDDPQETPEDSDSQNAGPKPTLREIVS
jgi:hypothetical protein